MKKLKAPLKKAKPKEKKFDFDGIMEQAKKNAQKRNEQSAELETAQAEKEHTQKMLQAEKQLHSLTKRQLTVAQAREAKRAKKSSS